MLMKKLPLTTPEPWFCAFSLLHTNLFAALTCLPPPQLEQQRTQELRSVQGVGRHLHLVARLR